MIRTRALADLLRRRRRRLMTHFCLSIFRLRFLVCFQCRIGGARPMNGMVNSGQSTRAAAADLGVDQSTVVRARRGAEASPETVTGRRSNLSAGSGAPSAATG
jgi:hypothetical protein